MFTNELGPFRQHFVRFLAIFILVIPIELSAQSGTEAAPIEITDDFGHIELQGSLGGMGSWDVYLQIRSEGGFVVVCAAVFGTLGANTPRIKRSIDIRANGTRILRGITFATNHRPSANPNGKIAACRLTDKKYEPNMQFDVAFTDTRDRIDARERRWPPQLSD